MSNEVLTNPDQTVVVDKVEEKKPLTIQDLFMSVMGRKAKIMQVGQSQSNVSKKHMTKEKVKAKRKIAKASRKRNR